MLSGEFRHNIDQKNRIFIPAGMRDELGPVFIIAKSLREKCLKVYSPGEWEAYMAPLMQQNRKLQEKAIRFLTSTAAEVSPDSQGRIVLPKHLIDFAGIERNAVVVGCYKYAEIWAENEYDASRADEDISGMIAELESYGL